MRFDMIVKGGSVVTPGEGVMRADVAVRGGRVAALIDDASGAEADDVYDASGLHVFPGVVDPHVHIGLAEGLDDWATETRSAAVGGVTTALTYLMAGTSYGPIVEANLDRAARDSVVDYGFHLVPSAPVHLDEMDEHAERYGIKSYKYFTSFRGDEGAYLGISGTDDGFMYRYFDQVSKLPGGVANVHPENIEVVWELRKRLLAEGRDDLKAWDESRPDFVEAQSAVAAAFYAHVTGCPLYIVHVSGRLALDELRAARERYGAAPLYIETCPHFLTHHSGMEIGPLGKVNPPLRSEDDEEALWDGLADGAVDTVGSDHVARKKGRKEGSIWTCSAGFPGSATILPTLLSEGYHRRGLPLERIAELTSANPARIFHRYPQKGTIAVGSDADFAIVDLGLEQEVTHDYLQSNADYSLLDGWRLTGWPVATILGGKRMVERGKLVGPRGAGAYVPSG